MTTSPMDQPPKMTTITAGEGTDQLVLDIPEDSIRGLDPEKKAATIQLLARFVMALGGNAELTEEDVATVVGLPGMLMTMPGTKQPISMQEFFGNLLVTGSPEDIAALQGPDHQQ